MNINGGDKRLKYIRYSRKSSEAKEKQALSITDQNKECDQYAQHEGIKFAYRFEESKTSYKPHKRPVFDQIVKMIENGEINALVTWKEDRICRNPEEGGKILQLLQDRKLAEIRCVASNSLYTSESDHLILQIHFGMANQYSRNLSQNVRRGLHRKAADRKEYPRASILGFKGIGERGRRNIEPHPIEAPLIAKAFEMASIGTYSLDEIGHYLSSLGMRTKRGKTVSRSHLQYILTCPTYYGFFMRNGELYEGSYEPVISKGLFDLVQEKLSDRSRPKQNIWKREFVGLIRCGQCSCAITTTVKKKFVKSKKAYLNYIYHHCTHRKGNCNQRAVNNDELISMFKEEIGKISINDEVWKLGIELVRSKHSSQIDQNKKQLQILYNQQDSTRNQIDRLIEMRAGGELTKDEFLEQKNRLVEKLATLDRKAQDNSHSVKTWLELMEDFFNTAIQVREIMDTGNSEQKQIILSKVGENYSLRDKKLTFRFKKPYDVLLDTESCTNVLRD